MTSGVYGRITQQAAEANLVAPAGAGHRRGPAGRNASFLGVGHTDSRQVWKELSDWLVNPYAFREAVVVHPPVVCGGEQQRKQAVLHNARTSSTDLAALAQAFHERVGEQNSLFQSLRDHLCMTQP